MERDPLWTGGCTWKSAKELFLWNVRKRKKLMAYSITRGLRDRKKSGLIYGMEGKLPAALNHFHGIENPSLHLETHLQDGRATEMCIAHESSLPCGKAPQKIQPMSGAGKSNNFRCICGAFTLYWWNFQPSELNQMQPTIYFLLHAIVSFSVRKGSKLYIASPHKDLGERDQQHFPPKML